MCDAAGVSRSRFLEQRVRGDFAPGPPAREPVQRQLRPVQGDGGSEAKAAGDAMPCDAMRCDVHTKMRFFFLVFLLSTLFFLLLIYSLFGWFLFLFYSCRSVAFRFCFL